MRGTVSRCGGLLLACVALFGCGEERERPPPAAVSGGGRPGIGGGDDDAGGATSDEDAGSMPPPAAADGGDGEFDVLPGECDPVDLTSIGGDGTINEVSLPVDFTVTRVESTWEGGCRNPTVRVTLSDGDCPHGNGHELVFSFEAEALDPERLLITGGQNAIRPEPDDVGLRIRYRRPDLLDPTGEWGTCTDAEGFVNFLEIPSARRNDSLVATFQVDLTPCADGTEGTQMLVGEFNASLQRGLTDVCPATP